MADVDLNTLAQQAGDVLLEHLHSIQAAHGGHAGVASALSAMSAAVNFIRTACGDDATADACAMVAAVARDRLDVVMPAGRTRA